MMEKVEILWEELTCKIWINLATMQRRAFILTKELRSCWMQRQWEWQWRYSLMERETEYSERCLLFDWLAEISFLSWILNDK
jgi:hypothetical protein